MFESIIQWTSIILALGATFFLSKANIVMSVKDIAELSATKYGSNPKVMENLAHQNANSRIGIVLLLISILFQMISNIIISGDKPTVISLTISFVIGVMVLLFCWRLAISKGNEYLQQANKIKDNRKKGREV